MPGGILSCKMHLWSPRRGKSNKVKRSMMGPTTTTALVTGTSASRLSPSCGKVGDEDEESGVGRKEVGMDREGDRRGLAVVAKEGVSAARTALLGSGMGMGMGFGGEIFGKAGKEDREEGWAPGLFYAYARRTNLPNSSRYILTFSSAKTCQEWWNLVQSEFGGIPSNSRESAQLFSFSGDDMPGRAWKNPRFERLKTKWFYTQMGEAVGTVGRGMEVLPLQDEKGWNIGVTPLLREKASAEHSAIQRRTSSVESLNEMKGRAHERRRSKRDSGILLMSPFSEHFNGAEEANKSQRISEDSTKAFDFERMEKNLEKVEKMMEQNAQQMRSLEHIQAANLERLTAALLQNVEMVTDLARGQEGLVHACEELRAVVDKREEDQREKTLLAEKAERERQLLERLLLEEKINKDRELMAKRAEKEVRERQLFEEKINKDREVMAKKAEMHRQKLTEQAEKQQKKLAEMAKKAEKERKVMAAALEKLERESRSDREERGKRSRSKEVEGQHLARSQSMMSTATHHHTNENLSPSGHVMRRAPRKLGRQVVGYIYANEEPQDEDPIRRDKRKTERG